MFCLQENQRRKTDKELNNLHESVFLFNPVESVLVLEFAATWNWLCNTLVFEDYRAVIALALLEQLDIYTRGKVEPLRREHISWLICVLNNCWGDEKFRLMYVREVDMGVIVCHGSLEHFRELCLI